MSLAGVRAVAHVHSDWSYDGTWKLVDLVRAFRRRRYRAVLMAEHDLGFDEERWQAYRDACADATTPDLLMVPGMEYSDANNLMHVLVWGELPFLGEGIETGQLLATVAEMGGVSVLAHPARRDVWKQVDRQWLCRLTGVELWNRKYDGVAPSPIARELLGRRDRLVPFVGSDFHTARQFFPLAMAIDAADVTPSAVFSAMREGHCRPQAFRLPAGWLARGPGFAATRAAERMRRPAARMLRRRLRRAG